MDKITNREMDEAVNKMLDEAPFVAKLISAVITYTDNGTRRPCGQTVGADGRGTYAVLVSAPTPEEAEDIARAHIKKLEAYGYRGQITNIVLVVNYPGFCSDAFQYLPKEEDDDD